MRRHAYVPSFEKKLAQNSAVLSPLWSAFCIFLLNDKYYYKNGQTVSISVTVSDIKQ